MRYPQAVLFDYGQTLIREEPFDGERGFAALLLHATANPQNVSAAQMEQLAQQLRRQMGHNDADFRINYPVEVHHHLYQNLLFEYLDLQFSLTPQQVEEVFWDAAAPATASAGVAELLRVLQRNSIPTGVLSNLTFSQQTLQRRINRLLPENQFRFIMVSSQYALRKPSAYLFAIAAKRLKVPAADIWFCGDNFAADIEGAHGAGMFPVWYAPGGEVPPKQAAFQYLTVRHWDEMRALLEDKSRFEE